MAAAIGEDDAAVPRRLGTITLQPAQSDAAARLLRLIRAHAGALLADPVGSGKTYVALAVAHALGPPAIVAPAALRTMWRRACAAAALSPVAILSLESLGRRGWTPPASLARAALLVVDEAHHVRNRRTRRWRALAALCAERPVLLLSATPVHNAPRELRALLALFLGSAAERADVSAHVVRRPLPDDGDRPAVDDRGTLPVRTDPSLLRELLALPPPLPDDARMGEGAGALATLGLVRAWASSDGALRAALRRRLTRTAAIAAILAEGRRPEPGELARWIAGDGVVQLGLPGLAPATGAGDVAPLRDAVERHAAALHALLVRLDAASPRAGADAIRAAHLARLLADPTARIVAFSHAARTVQTLFQRLRWTAGVAMLTGNGARVAGGTLSRAEVLARFAPRAQGARQARAAEDVRLLLATDLLSEGVNLQDANVVVHLDLPWTAARMAQRVGRVVRQGSPHTVVRVYRMGAPVSARRLLAIERRLRAKARHARAALGLAPAGGDEPARGQRAGSEDRQASAAELVRRALARWRGVPGARGCCRPGTTPVAVAHVPDQPRAGTAIALVRLAGRARLLAIPPRGRPTAAAARVAPLLARLVLPHGDGVPRPDTVRVQRALTAAAGWLRRAHAAAVLERTADGAASAPARRLAGLALQAVAAAPPHERASLAPLADTIRRAASHPLPAAAEIRLVELVSAAGERPDAAWLRATAAAAAGLLRVARPSTGDGEDGILALLLLDGVAATPPPG